MSANPLLALPHLADDLARVETELLHSVESANPFLTEVASHLIHAGGKRVRPGFTISAAAAAFPDARPAAPGVVSGGVAVELVHLGSLYHDDVMDDAMTRRTVESVNARWGNLKAILAGDYLLARASEIAAALGVEVAALLASTIARLCEGQVRELQDIYRIDRTEEDYFASIDGKTAALLATACRIGGIVSDLPREQIETLTTFGHAYGMAFQIVDDILDVVATDDQLGKPAGNDLVEGIYNLPVLRALETDVGTDLRHLLGEPLDDATRDKARDLVRLSGAIDSTLAEAHWYARQACDALSPLTGTLAATSLGRAADHLLDRVHAAAR